MSTQSESTTSAWMTVATSQFNELAQDITADVCIVGAGIAGLTTAYLLGQRGLNIVVLEDGRIGSGETSHTTAHLTAALDDRYFELERLHGADGARLAAASHSAAIDQIERIVNDERIACDFERLDGYLFTPPNESAEVLERELAAAQRAGLVNVELVGRAPIKGFDTGRALRFPGQAQFHPLKYLNGLAEAIRRRGGHIYTGTHAAEITGGDPASVTTANGHRVSCGAIVVATNTPVNDMVAIHTKQAPYRTYVVALRVPRGAVNKALFWDTLDPYHYVRLTNDEAAGAGQTELLIVGGEDHKTGQEDEADRFECLQAWARERFPEAGELVYQWSGQVLEPVDGLAFIGRNPLDADNVFIATGDSGNGMTHGTIAGMLLTDLITGRDNQWAELYNPARVKLLAASEFLSENLNVAAQYIDHLRGGDVDNYREIEPGEGAIVSHGLQKLAVYRDEQGRVHECSAICPHLGCVVQWNRVEKSWDCPCHGSRFDPLGVVLNGPANVNLKAKSES
jgi:glycine/D-amino acid oxidase-like deaminating enzyme/nitrite reductase/ring-hydroxylating ferredoxin subunit